MRQLDELYLKYPFFGSRKMAVELEINRKRAQRLMRILGIEAHYPKPNLSRPAPGHQIHPYLLRGVRIERPNHVWSTKQTTRLCWRGLKRRAYVLKTRVRPWNCTVPNTPVIERNQRK
jgi:hypothetical protein